MNKTINDIMEQYKAGKITLEEANAKLKGSWRELFSGPEQESWRRLDEGRDGGGLYSRSR